MSGSEIWNRRYSSETYAYGTEPNDFLVSVADRLQMGRVLCVAEGEGRNATYLASLGHDVTAVDFSVVGLSKAVQLAERRGVRMTTVQADLTDFDFGEEEWDAVISVFCHLEPGLRRRVHAGIETGLKTGGFLVLEGYTPRQLELGTGGPPTKELLVTLAELRRELPRLDFVIGREVERQVWEGSFHNGRGAVVQVLARRSTTRGPNR